jgi:RES domain-containing protein
MEAEQQRGLRPSGRCFAAHLVPHEGGRMGRGALTRHPDAHQRPGWHFQRVAARFFRAALGRVGGVVERRLSVRRSPANRRYDCGGHSQDARGTAARRFPARWIVKFPPPVAYLTQRNTVRLIPTGRLKPAALRPLIDNEEELGRLALLESATSGRVQAQESGMADLDPRELVFGSPGHTFINAAFTYTRPGGNRFNGDGRGAWYCAFAVETSLEEVAFHLTRELRAVGRFENVTDYAELFADFIGPFHDLRSVDVATEPCLGPDPTTAYPVGQALARRLRQEAESNGVVYSSVRHPGGTCLAAFRPNLVQNLRQGGIWRLAWQGAPEPSINRAGVAGTGGGD